MWPVSLPVKESPSLRDWVEGAGREQGWKGPPLEMPTLCPLGGQSVSCRTFIRYL